MLIKAFKHLIQDDISLNKRFQTEKWWAISLYLFQNLFVMSLYGLVDHVS